MERLEDKQYLGKHWNSDKWVSYHMGNEAENIQNQFLLVLDEVKKQVGKKRWGREVKKIHRTIGVRTNSDFLLLVVL